MARLDLLTRKGERMTIHLRRTHAPLAELAVKEINRRAPSLVTSSAEVPTAQPTLATLPE